MWRTEDYSKETSQLRVGSVVVGRITGVLIMKVSWLETEARSFVNQTVFTETNKIVYLKT